MECLDYSISEFGCPPVQRLELRGEVQVSGCTNVLELDELLINNATQAGEGLYVLQNYFY